MHCWTRERGNISRSSTFHWFHAVLTAGNIMVRWSFVSLWSTPEVGIRTISNWSIYNIQQCIPTVERDKLHLITCHYRKNTIETNINIEKDNTINITVGISHFGGYKKREFRSASGRNVAHHQRDILWRLLRLRPIRGQQDLSTWWMGRYHMDSLTYILQ